MSVMSSFVGVCVICLAHNNNLRRLLEVDYDNLRMLDKLKYCFGHIVYDDIHCSICMICVQELHRSFEFKKMVMTNQDRLKNYLSFYYMNIHASAAYNKCQDINNAKISTEHRMENGPLKRNVESSEIPNSERATCCAIGEELDIKEEPIDYVEDLTENPREEFSDAEQNTYLSQEHEDGEFRQENVETDDLYGPLEYGRSEFIRNKCNIEKKVENFNSNLQEKYSVIRTSATRHYTEVNPFIPLNSEPSVSRSQRKGVGLQIKTENDDDEFPIHVPEIELINATDVENTTEELDIKSMELNYAGSFTDMNVKEENLGQLNSNSHLKTEINNSGKRYSCHICQMRFAYRCYLKTHMNTHTGVKPYNCNVCQRQFSLKGNLKQHMTVHTGEKAHICKVCHRQFSQSGNLKQHMRTHTGVRPYSCNECDKQFSQIGNLKQHMVVHTGVKSYSCKECHKQFTQLSGLNQHMVIHTNQKPYSCKECNQQFRQLSNLNQHMMTHTGSKPYTCEECQKEFSEKGNLKQHMIIHTGTKPHTCKECHKQFSFIGNLKQHMTVHTGAKPYSCNECNKQFSQMGTLKQHMTVHTGMRPYSCKQCHKEFSQKGNLKQHMVVHTGVKSYSCTKCPKKFGQIGNLKQHMTTHVKNTNYAV